MAEQEQPPKTVKDGLGRTTIEATDYDGNTIQIPVLRNRDLEDIEAFVGGWTAYYDDDVKVRNANYLLWCAVRNLGLTREQRVKGEWKYTRDEVKDMFGGMGVTMLMALTSRVLNASGFITRVMDPREKEAPSSGPLDVAVASATGEISTPAPAPSV